MLALTFVIILVRVNGLRSFSKMTNFDFVVTVAVGSLLASASLATGWATFTQALFAMAALFVMQFLVSRLRKVFALFESLLQNEPIVLMRDGEIFEEALNATRVARGDLIAKLREANVLKFSDVRAVILETTGDISVLHGEECAEDLMEGTKRIDR